MPCVSEAIVPATVSYRGRPEFSCGEAGTLSLDVRVEGRAWPAGSRIWVCMDIRQGCGPIQGDDPAGSGYASAVVLRSGTRLQALQPGPAGLPCRSMDWLPEMPEFVALVEFRTHEELAPSEIIRVEIGGSAGFAMPTNSIDEFHLWVLVDAAGAASLQPDVGKGYFRANYGVVPVNWVDRHGEAVLPPQPLPTSPNIRITGGAPERLLMVAPTVVSQNQLFEVRASVVDGSWNPAAGQCRPGPVTLIRDGQALRSFTVDWQPPAGAGHSARAWLPGITESGVYSLAARDGSLAEAESNSFRVVDRPPDFAPYWGDLHTMLFDSRPFADYFHYARDTMLLDFGACMRFSYNIVLGKVWEDLWAAVERFNEPGRFVTFHAVECGITNGGIGHKNVYMMRNAGAPFMAEVREPVKRPLFRQRVRSDAVIIEDLEQFWAEVERRDALVLCHHTVEWTHHNPRFERCAEVYSKWGRSEYSGNPDWHTYNRPLQEGLASGLRLGVVAGTDSHDSRACNPAPEWALPYSGGLTAVFARSLSREDLWEALYARRTCATTGTRTAVALKTGAHWMGEEVTAVEPPSFSLQVTGSAPIQRLALIRDNETVALWHDLPTSADLTWSESERLAGTHYYYARVTQTDGNMAWSSPIWVTIA